MLRNLIYSLGVRAVARECGVNPGAVRYWAQFGLPDAPGHAKRRANYERVIAKMAKMKVGDLRKQLAEEEAAKAA